MDDKLNDTWKDILSIAREKLPQGATEIWLKTCLPISLDRGKLVLDVPNVFVKEQIQSRFLSGLKDLVADRGIAREVELVVGTEVRDGEQKRAENALKQPPPPNPDGLNPNYYFDTFVVGKSNRLAHAASLAVAESPGVAYNPLFIWGGVGLGKTHLMHAIGHYVLEHLPGARSLCQFRKVH